MILVLHSEKLDEPIEIPLPEDWYSALLNHQMDLGHKTISETINHMLKEYVDEQIKKLEEEKKEKRHEEFQKEAEKRKQIFTGLRIKGKKI